MKKTWFVVAALVLVIAVAGFSGCSQTATPSDVSLNLNNQQEGIWITGTGKVTVIPDVATIRTGVESTETTVAQAQVKAAEAMDSVIKVLTDNGVARKDIQTQQFNIQRITRWDKDTQQEVITGYRVTNIVTAKIRDIAKTGAIIDAVAQAGGDLTRVDSISFSVDKPETYYGEARQKAIEDAKTKAEQLARLTEVKLGKPTYILENAQYPEPRYYSGKADAGAPVETPISPGELEVTLTIQLVYAIVK